MDDISPTEVLEEYEQHLDTTSAICESIDKKLPTRLRTELQNSIWQLYYSTIYARSHRQQVSSLGLSTSLKQSLSITEALLLLTSALSDVYTYMGRVKLEFTTIPDKQSESEAKSFVQKACTEIQALESNLNKGSAAIALALQSQHNDLQILAHADSMQYEAFSKKFIFIFRENPFSLSKSHFSDSLTILNNFNYIRIGSPESIRNPCFQSIALEGKLWVSNQEKQEVARTGGKGGSAAYSLLFQPAPVTESSSSTLEPKVDPNAQGSGDTPNGSIIGTVPSSAMGTSFQEVGQSGLPSSSLGPAPALHIVPSRRPIHAIGDLLLEVTEKNIDRGQVHTKATGLDTAWNDIIQSLSRELSKVKAVTKDAKNRTSAIPRFAVCGKTKAGKSTTINSLFGFSLLATYVGACTAWPILIRHVPGTDKPTLRVDTTQFDDMMKDIRSWNLPALKSHLPEHSELLANYDTFDNILKEASRKFTDTNFKFRVISEGAEEVNETITAINHLIRIYNSISPNTFSLKTTGSTFPILTVSLQGFAGQLEPMEFLDLPGIGDDALPSGVLLNIYTSCIFSCQGIICIEPCDRGALDTKGVGKVNKILALVKDHMPPPEAQFLGDRPMIVVATQMDLCLDWEQGNSNKFAGKYLPGYQLREALGRVHYCAPALHLGGEILNRMVDDEQNGIKMPDFEVLLKTRGVSEVLTWRLGRFGGPVWNGFGTNQRLEVANHAKLASEMDGLQELIRNRLYLEVKDGAYEYIMGKLASTLKDLWDQQQMILEKASKYEQDYITASKKCSLFRDQLQLFCAQWYSQRPELTVQWKTTLEPHLKQAMIGAKEAISLVIEEITASYVTEDDTITFASKTEATKFLITLAKAMRDPLDEVQLKLVEAVREIARKTWTSRIQALASSQNFLTDTYNNSAVESLKEQIKVDLENLSSRRIADAVAKIVYERIESTMTSDSRSNVMDWSAVHQAQQAVLERVVNDLNGLTIREKQEDEDEQRRRFTEDIGSLKVHSASGSDETVGRIERIPSAASLSEEEAKATLDESINFMGFLIRSPVLASLVSCPHTAAIWPFLNDPRPTITIDVIRRTYDNYMMNAWNTIVVEESYKTLSGSIVASDVVGMRTILDAVKAKEEKLSQSLQACNKGMSPAEVEEYLLLQANYIGLFGAAQELERRLREDRTSRFKSAKSTR
ncbi:hypothetical protein FRC17_003758 [Serendipita sp. 399]|nr:hypothetical protein FRC17_003758 [Serendipita sp. 399]